jgi:hypothetical protein
MPEERKQLAQREVLEAEVFVGRRALAQVSADDDEVEGALLGEQRGRGDPDFFEALPLPGDVEIGDVEDLHVALLSDDSGSATLGVLRRTPGAGFELGKDTPGLLDGVPRTRRVVGKPLPHHHRRITEPDRLAG